MSFQADGELSSIEATMLAIVKDKLAEFQENSDDGSPIPQTLIMAYDKCHASILRHIAKGSAMDMNQIMKNPRAWLLQNDRMRARVLQLIEQQEQVQKPEGGVLRTLPGVNGV